MSIAYVNFNTNEVKNKELARLVHRLQELTVNDKEALNNNYELFETSFKKILRLSKQEKEWYLYFYSIRELISLSNRHEKFPETIKYAELYYQESDLYMDRELPNYPGTYMGYLNTHIYRDIFYAYNKYHQINDYKMESFMRKYEECALKYGDVYLYYEDEMKLSVLYRDADRAKRAAEKFKRYEKDIRTCYVCRYKSYLSCLLLADQWELAEELMLNYIYKKIPKRHLWCYQGCELKHDVPEKMYSFILYQCIWGGKEEAYRYFFEKYWRKLPREVHEKPTGGTIGILLRAAVGVFDDLKDDLQLMEVDINETGNYTTVGNMEYALQWWCYFTLLDRSGVHKVEISLPGLNVSDTLSVASYMEKRADKFGALFSKARARFDYEGLKGTYRNCFLSDNLLS